MVSYNDFCRQANTALEETDDMEIINGMLINVHMYINATVNANVDFRTIDVKSWKALSSHMSVFCALTIRPNNHLSKVGDF